MAKYTIIGEYWDNEQGYATHVEAENEDAAIELAQTECLAELNDGLEDPLDKRTDEPLRIMAVLEGWPKVVSTHDV